MTEFWIRLVVALGILQPVVTLLPNDKPSVSFCTHYNRTDCERAKKTKNPAEEKKYCEPRTKSCTVNTDANFCFNIWVERDEPKTNSTTDIEIFRGCYQSSSATVGCDNAMCIANQPTRQSASDVRWTCCCTENLCNMNRTIVRPSIIAEASESVTDAPDPHFAKKTVGIALPIGIIGPVVIVSIFCYIQSKKRRREALSPETIEDEMTEQDSELDPSLSLLAERAQGRYGTVWYGGEVNGIQAAIKQFNFSHRKGFLQERSVYRLPGMKHENITLFLGASEKGEGNNAEMWIVLEYHPHGSIYDYLKGHVISWPDMLSVGRGMMAGLAYLHDDIMLPDGNKKWSIAHRDIKSKNILVKNNMSACIADFGLAQKLENGRVGDSQIQAGTHRYMAPEVLEGAITFTKESFLRIDIYAAALVLWELLTRCEISGSRSAEYKLPYADEEGSRCTSLLETLQVLVGREKMRPKFPECLHANPDTRSLMQTIEEAWDHDAEARLSAGCIEARLTQLYELSLNNTTDCLHQNRLNTLITNDSNTQQDSLTTPLIIHNEV